MNRSSNKYYRLMSNTVLFAVSTFSSKILSFLLTRLYTGVLSKASYGIVDLVIASGNLLMPLVSFGIFNAVVRFGLEKDVSKKGVFTGSLFVVLSGFALLVLFAPLIGQISVLQGNVTLMYIFVLFSCLRTLCGQFVRARQYIRLYAIDGILSTVFTIGFNVLFLVVLRMGAAGYLLSIIAADFLSIVFLFLTANLKSYIDPKAFDIPLLKAMLRYSLPLVPALMFWWITSASDRFFIAYMHGTMENGLYAAANKIPSVVMLVSTIFTEAWQLSAVTDGQGADRNLFFSKVYAAVMGFGFFIGGVLVYSNKFIMRYLVAPDYFPAWKYVPILVVASVFCTLVTFLNSVYMVEKRSGMAMATMSVGAFMNLILNALLIPGFGPNGAAFATFLSYVAVFILRVLSTRQMVKIQIKPLQVFVNTVIILLIGFMMMWDVRLWQVWGALGLLVMAIVNYDSLFGGILQVLKMFRRKKNQTE